jgi:hypothetical protein
MPDLHAAGMLDRIRRIVDSLPDRIPAALHVGPHVLDVLLCTATSGRGGTTFGTPVIVDPDMPAGSWRFVDRHGQELHAGNLWPPHLPVHETGYLPAGTSAVVYTPPDDGAPFAGEACVFVRPSRHPDRTTP